MRASAARALINRKTTRRAAAAVEAVGLAPDVGSVPTSASLVLSCEFAVATMHLDKAIELGADSPTPHWSGLLERRGVAAADAPFGGTHALDPQGYPMPVRMSRKECLAAVERRLRLPREFDKYLERRHPSRSLPSDAILKEFEPPMDRLLGLCRGSAHRQVLDGRLAACRHGLIFQRPRWSCDDHETLVVEIFTTPTTRSPLHRLRRARRATA